jgi:hypothetical protein
MAVCIAKTKKDMSKMKPIFFIGNGRSGTTIIAEVFSNHSEFGWLSNYSAKFPRFAPINITRMFFQNWLWYITGQKRQHINLPWYNKACPRITEAYPFWQVYAGEKFLWDFLINAEATPVEAHKINCAIRKILFFQGKKRFLAKITGPPKIGFLRSVFPDASFIHIVRDGRAVVNSLLKVDFWKHKGGLNQPFWRGGLTEDDMKYWNRSGNSPVALAALQWRRIIEVVNEEKKLLKEDAFLEVKYEDFTLFPNKVVNDICDHFQIKDESILYDYIKRLGPYRNMNFKYKQMAPKDIALMEDIMGKQLCVLGYDV